MLKVFTAVSLSIILVLFSIFFLRGEEDTWKCENGKWVMHGRPYAAMPEEPCPANIEEPADGSPENVVNTFYLWYLEQPDRLNSYKDSPILSDGYKVKVKGVIDNNLIGGYDPIILAQDIPDLFSTGNAVIEGEIARVPVIQHYGSTTKIITVALQNQKGDWKITDILPSEETLSQEETARKVIIYFPNLLKSSGTGECDSVFGVERLAGKHEGYEAVLRQLFIGPTKLEQDNGYSSFFSKVTDKILISIQVDNTTAYVNLKDIRNIIPNASSSCGSQSFFAQVNETLMHDRKITKVLFAIEGNPQTFYEWMQIGCAQENNYCDKKPFR